MRTNYKAVDITKFILAYIVLTVHCMNYNLNDNRIYFYIEHYIFRMSVPLFFLFSGFFLGIKVKKCEEKKTEYIKACIRNLMIHYLFWNIIYGVITIMYDIKHGLGMKEIVFVFVRNTLTFNSNLMWYIGSLVFSYLVFAFIKTQNALKISLVVAALLYIVGIFMGSYSGVFRGTAVEEVLQLYYRYFVNSSNGLFVGYVFVGHGFYYARYVERETSKRKIISAVFVGYLILTAEMMLIKRIPSPMEGHYDFLLGNLFICIPMFLLILQCKVSDHIDTKFFRKASSCIYFSHMMVVMGLSMLLDIYWLYIYVLAVIITTVGAYIVYKWNNKYVNMVT